MKGGKIYIYINFRSERGVKISIFRRRRMVIIIIALHYIQKSPFSEFLVYFALVSKLLSLIHKNTHSAKSLFVNDMKIEIAKTKENFLF